MHWTRPSHERPESVRTQALERLEQILKSTLARFEQQDRNTIYHSMYVATLSLLGVCYEIRGATQAALECYGRGLQAEPNNDALLVAKGILLSGQARERSQVLKWQSGLAPLNRCCRFGGIERPLGATTA
jgi:tetratricopeptide (TPR) repeat protein